MITEWWILVCQNSGVVWSHAGVFETELEALSWLNSADGMVDRGYKTRPLKVFACPEASSRFADSGRIRSWWILIDPNTGKPAVGAQISMFKALVMRGKSRWGSSEWADFKIIHVSAADEGSTDG